MAIVDEDGADHGIGTGAGAPLRGQVEGLFQVIGVSHSNRDSMKRSGLEGQQIVHFLANADVADGQVEFAGDRDDDAAFRRAIELGENDAGNAGAFGELAGLFEAVLAGGGVEHEQDFMGRAGDDAGGRAAHLFKLRHQVDLGLQAAGGVDDDVVDFARFGGLEGVEDDGAGIGSGLLANDIGAGAFAPDFKLFYCRGAECIGGGQDHGAAFALITLREFADGGGLPCPVHTHDHDDSGRLGDARHGAVGRFEDFKEVLFDEAFDFGGVIELVTLGAFADAVEDLVGGFDADIGAEEGVFKLIEEIGIDLFFAADGVFERGDKPGAGFLDPGFELIEKRRLLRDGAE